MSNPWGNSSDYFIMPSLSRSAPPHFPFSQTSTWRRCKISTCKSISSLNLEIKALNIDPAVSNTIASLLSYEPHDNEILHVLSVAVSLLSYQESDIPKNPLRSPLSDNVSIFSRLSSSLPQEPIVMSIFSLFSPWASDRQRAIGTNGLTNASDTS